MTARRMLLIELVVLAAIVVTFSVASTPAPSNDPQFIKWIRVMNLTQDVPCEVKVASDQLWCLEASPTMGLQEHMVNIENVAAMRGLNIFRPWQSVTGSDGILHSIAYVTGSYPYTLWGVFIVEHPDGRLVIHVSMATYRGG